MSSNQVAPVRNDPIDARVAVDYEDPTSFEVLDLLRSAGFRVINGAPVSGLPQPEVVVESTIYRGLREVRDLVNSRRSNGSR